MRKTFVSLAISLLLSAGLLASDPYVIPGGLNQTIAHWSYPDYNTMALDTGLFSQDINKIAFERDNLSFWYLLTPGGAGNPSWQWFGGGPWNYDPLNSNVAATFTGYNLGAYVKSVNLTSGIGASAGFRAVGSPSHVGTFEVLSSAYSGNAWIIPGSTYISSDLDPVVIKSVGPIRIVNTTGSAYNTNGVVKTSAGTGDLIIGPDVQINASTSDQTGFASDQYLTGSEVTTTAGDWRVKGQYHCRFDMTKTAAGVATPIITVRMGTLATTGDAAIAVLTFGAGTAAVDLSVIDININFRTVGSGTSAVISVDGFILHQTAGLTPAGNGMIFSTSSGFNSTTQTKLGLSFNGGASFAGTCHLIQSELKQ
jgi:hypothetical protein